ncbi:zinc finger protein 597 isoform X1 [Leptonychotes weddellii]|uniref:Zinc finger protein 597 isoform X1 n=1 Tax=Leptonychotes weddellii TaxID=9713 RepID=A0A7F8RP00_LEPWE|nr:zinc finger protein 597 isoform X1 [Leptonychotes weddellii]XP_030894739.1 zinc finger protein 597 isoform X1 [Leptonychotes weddellii]
MASTLPTTGAQGPMLFEDLAVYFSQEEYVSLHPAQRSLSRDTTQECFEDMALMDQVLSAIPAVRPVIIWLLYAWQLYLDLSSRRGGEGKTEISQQLNLESAGFEELAPENSSITVPLIYYPEKSETGVGDPERKVSGGAPACKKRFISLLVTIENQTPLQELSQCLGTRALSEILEFPGEEAKNLYKCPECDESFSDNSYLVLHQKTHSGEKKYKCGDCGKIFNHRANLRTHRRIHTGEKPYKCAECGSSFRQHSHLSRHMNIHIKEKPHRCGICGRGFMWLPGLSQHQKTHAAKKAYECTDCGKYFGQKTNLALHEKTHTSATQYQRTQCVKCFGQSSHLVLPEQGHADDSEHCSDCGENMLLFSKFKPLKCPECAKTFLRVSELISHQSIHRGEKPHKCKTCAKSFILDSELACHQKNHTGEEPFKCTMCGKSFRLNMHLIVHQQTHTKTTM